MLYSCDPETLRLVLTVYNSMIDIIDTFTAKILAGRWTDGGMVGWVSPLDDVLVGRNAARSQRSQVATQPGRNAARSKRSQVETQPGRNAARSNRSAGKSH